MEFSAAQRDLAAASIGGAPGVLVSGLVWLAAGLVWQDWNVALAFGALFAGGMLIVPASLAIARLVFRAPQVSPGNPLGRLGLESTFVLFGGILLAYIMLHTAPKLVFPAMAITIGVRYFAFRTLYDEPTYWLLGASLAAIGAVSAMGLVTLPINLALAVGMIEIGFAALLFARWKRRACESEVRLGNMQ
jgi:FtsH-binding integral membrane protein